MRVSIFEYPFDSDLSSYLSDIQELKILGFYGEINILNQALNYYFCRNDQLIKKPGIFFCHLVGSPKSALVLSYENNTFIKQNSWNSFGLKFLIGTCKTIVPCISKYSIQRWYYSDKAIFYSQFSKSFNNNISLSNIFSSRLFLGRPNEPKHFKMNLSGVFLSKTSAYKYKDIYNDNSLIEFTKLKLDFISTVFDISVDIEKISELYEKFLLSVDNYLYCSQKILHDVFNDLQNLLLEYESRKSEEIRFLCKEIKFGLFGDDEEANLRIENFIENFQSVFIKHFSITDQNKNIEIFRDLILRKLPLGNKPSAFSLFKNELSKAVNKISQIKESNKNLALSKLSCFESFLIKKLIKISKFKAKKKLNSVIDYETKVFKLVISVCFQIGNLISIVELENDSIACLFEVSENGVVNLFVYNYDGKFTYLTFSGINYVISKGSDSSSIIIINNSKFTAQVYSVQEGQLILKYEKNVKSHISFPHYLKKTDKLVFLNQQKQLVWLKLSGDEEIELFDLMPFSIFTKYWDEKVTMLVISDDEELMCIKVTDKILIFHISLEIKYELEIENTQFKSFYVSNIENEYFIVIIEKASSRTYALSIFNNEEKVSRGNAVLDIVEYSFISLDRPISIASDSLYTYIQEGFTCDCIKSYYSILKNCKKVIKFKGLFNRENTADFISYSSKTFSYLLLSYSQVALIKSRSFDVYLNEKEVLKKKEIKFDGKSYVTSIRDMVSYGFFESQIKSIDKLSIISIIGYDDSLNELILSNIFKVQTQGEGKNKITMNFTTLSDKHLILLAYSKSDLVYNEDSLKIFEFLSSISDRIIVTSRISNLEKITLILKQLLFSRFRINEPLFYNFHLDLLILDYEESIINSVISKYIPHLPKMPENFSVNFLSKKESSIYLPECLMFRNNMLLNEEKYSGGSFLNVLKLVISQIYTGDFNSLKHWEQLADNMHESLESLCDHKGNCGFSVEIYNKQFKKRMRRLAKGHAGVHYCDEKCSKCSSFCELEYGHFGYHSSKRHANSFGIACDIEFFRRTNVDDFQMKKIFKEMQDSWHEVAWETPYESIYGLS